MAEAGLAPDSQIYDFWQEKLETHRENGYLLFVACCLLLYDGVIVLAVLLFPTEDVYLVPGVGDYGEADIHWASPVPEVGRGLIGAAADQEEHRAVIELPALPDPEVVAPRTGGADE